MCRAGRGHPWLNKRSWAISGPCELRKCSCGTQNEGGRGEGGKHGQRMAGFQMNGFSRDADCIDACPASGDGRGVKNSVPVQAPLLGGRPAWAMLTGGVGPCLACGCNGAAWAGAWPRAPGGGWGFSGAPLLGVPGVDSSTEAHRIEGAVCSLEQGHIIDDSPFRAEGDSRGLEISGAGGVCQLNVGEGGTAMLFAVPPIVQDVLRYIWSAQEDEDVGG